MNNIHFLSLALACLLSLASKGFATGNEAEGTVSTVNPAPVVNDDLGLLKAKPLVFLNEPRNVNSETPFCTELNIALDMMQKDVKYVAGEKHVKQSALGEREYWDSELNFSGAEKAELYVSYRKNPNQWYLVVDYPISNPTEQYASLKTKVEGCLNKDWISDETVTQFGTTNKFYQATDDSVVCELLYLTLVKSKSGLSMVISLPINETKETVANSAP